MCADIKEYIYKRILHGLVERPPLNSKTVNALTPYINVRILAYNPSHTLQTTSRLPVIPKLRPP